MLDTPFTPWPEFTKEEADAVARVLLSNRVNYWTGTECREFEREFAAWAGCAHAVALANGTVALDLALHVLGIGPGDDVVVTPRTFIASVSCVVNAGARPVFADVDRDSQNITAESIRAVLTPRTRAVICVHLAGMPCDMDPILKLAAEKGLFIIEDCAQAHGARYKGRPVGAIGDLGAWSFCQDKIITTGGEGGMLTTNRREWWEKAWSYKDHGKSWEAVYRQQHPPGFRWLHETIGTNWRLTEMQAAIGRIQLKRMPEWHAVRTRHAEVIRAAARALPALRVPALPEDTVHAWYKCYLFVRPERLRSGWSRDRILEEINRRGVPCYTGICPEVYLEKAFDKGDSRPRERLPAAKELGETSLMFLVHPTLTREEIEKTCRVLTEVLESASAQTRN
ncbi:MAG: DegT/DnrJ/EryC1/StrS aminotransferase family protein [Syntrophaceae bacterium]|nr:DegT/DnrJ/EryC1/StrS aminotransferase family protein [Syntrophaceae bacterium]